MPNGPVCFSALGLELELRGNHLKSALELSDFREVELPYLHRGDNHIEGLFATGAH